MSSSEAFGGHGGHGINVDSTVMTNILEFILSSIQVRFSESNTSMRDDKLKIMHSKNKSLTCSHQNLL